MFLGRSNNQNLFNNQGQPLTRRPATGFRKSANQRQPHSSNPASLAKKVDSFPKQSSFKKWESLNPHFPKHHVRSQISLFTGSVLQCGCSLLSKKYILHFLFVSFRNEWWPFHWARPYGIYDLSPLHSPSNFYFFLCSLPFSSLFLVGMLLPHDLCIYVPSAWYLLLSDIHIAHALSSIHFSMRPTLI